jgi:hypothetical protein
MQGDRALSAPTFYCYSTGILLAIVSGSLLLFKAHLTSQFVQTNPLHDVINEGFVSTNTTRTSWNEGQYYSRREFKVNEYKYQVILGPSRQSICLNNTFMIVLVLSHPSYTDRRQAIRRTWGRSIQTSSPTTWPHIPTCCPRIRLFFLLGLDQQRNRDVRTEQSQYDDILQGDFVDSYRNVTLKSLLALKIVLELCPNVGYLLKCDDDMFVNVPFMLDMIHKVPQKHGIMGTRIEGALPRRTGKWSLSHEQFPFNILPPYVHGSSYIVSSDVVRKLYEASEYVPWLPLEDVYITGILARIVGIRHVTLSDSPKKGAEKFARPNGQPARVCDVIKRRVMTATNMTAARLYKIWNSLQGPRNRCK